MLSYKPDLVGLSKKKILLVAILLILSIFAFLMWGTTNSPKLKQTENDTESLYFSNNASSLSSVNSIIEKATSSHEANYLRADTTQTLNESNAKVVKANVIVPPIIDSGATRAGDINDHIQHKLHNSMDDKSYSAIYAAKTVVFTADSNGGLFASSNLIAKRNPSSSSSISGNKVNSADTSAVNDEYKQKTLNESNTKFLDKSGNSTDYLNSEIQPPKSQYELKAGSVIPAIMVNGINSDLPGEVVAIVRENVYDSSTRRYLLIPQGAKLVGLYDSKIAYGQTRVLVAWNRLIYQDGSSINLKAMPGTDLSGYAGFYDQVDNKYWQIFGASFIMGVITGAMQYSQNNTNANVQSGGIGITTDNNPTVSQTLSGSLGQQLGQTGLSITQKNLNVQPTLIIRPNYPFNIMTTADIILKPYKY